MCLVDQATSTCREVITLTPLLRNHWHDFVMHAKWSANPSVGYLEMWIDGVNVLPTHRGANMFPGMRNYLSVGLYRDGHIGDPNLIWPPGTPLAGTHVYGTDGAPEVAYIDGFIAGKTRVAVEPPPPAPPPPPPPPPTTEGGTFAPSPGPSSTPTTPAVAAITGSSFMSGGGCATSGPQTAWLAAPLIGLLVLRRRRRA
jgi:MYXO-CTERM domain-containing protein